jgi:hypothetical protein
MKVNQVFVQGLKADGSIGAIDVLRLDVQSFRAFVLDTLREHEMLPKKAVRPVGGEPIVYREQVGELLKLTTV